MTKPKVGTKAPKPAPAKRKSRSKPRLNKDGSPKVLSTLGTELEKLLEADVVTRPLAHKGHPLAAVKDKLYLCVPHSGWGKLARRLSENLPGQVWVGSSGITHACGNKIAWVTSADMLQGILEARALAFGLISQEKWWGELPEPEQWKYAQKYQFDGFPYSVAGNARILLAWTKCTQPSRELDRINADSMWQFQLCRPAMLERAYLWDITSCYYSLLCRAPSPYVVLNEGELHFCEPSEPGEFDRWFAMLVAVGPHKGLRNSLVGQMFSSGDGEFYYDGRGNKDPKEKLDELRAEEEIRQEGMTGAALDLEARIKEKNNAKKKPKPGCLRPLASLVVRTAYELACLASKEEKAYYSNTDCVITTNPYCPDIWSKYRLQVALKGAGKAEICCIGNYRVGNKGITEPYRTHKKGEPRPRVPARPDPKAVRLILRGETWVDKWLVPDPGWEPDARVLDKMQEREDIADGLRRVAEIATQQENERENRRERRAIEQENEAPASEAQPIEKASEEQSLEEYASQVEEAF